MAKRKNLTLAQFQALTQSQKDKYLASPGLRSRLPDAALSAELLAKRKDAQAKKKAAAQDAMEVVPNSGLTFGKLKEMQRYNDTLQFADTDRELATQKAQLGANRTRDTQWFDTYQGKLASARAAEQTRVNTANTEANTAIDTQQGAQNAQAAKVADALRARAAGLNMADDTGAQYQMVSNEAAATRANSLKAQAEANRVRAQGTVSNMAAAETGAGLSRADAMANYNSKEALLGQKAADYEKKKGAAKLKFLDDQIQSAQKRVLENQVYAASLQKNSMEYKLAMAKLASDNKYRDAMLGLKEAALGIQQQNADTAAAKAANGGSSSSKSKSPRATGEQIQNFTNELSAILSRISSLRKRNPGSYGKNHGATRQKLIKDDKYNGTAINVALDIAYNKKISAANRRALHALGYKSADFPRYW